VLREERTEHPHPGCYQHGLQGLCPICSSRDCPMWSICIHPCSSSAEAVSRSCRAVSLMWAPTSWAWSRTWGRQTRLVGGLTGCCLPATPPGLRSLRHNKRFGLRSWRRPPPDASVRRKSASLSKEQGIQGFRPLFFVAESGRRGDQGHGLYQHVLLKRKGLLPYNL
jgi:hypothetical protein